MDPPARGTYVGYDAVADQTMSPTSSFAGSTGATLTRCRLRIKGTIDEPLGRNSTAAPAATLPAASNIPFGTA
jgi:hypothetical protein